MEKIGCKIIYGAPTTLAVKELIMMMMMMKPFREQFCHILARTNLLAECSELAKALALKPGAGQNKALLASPTVRSSVFEIVAIPGHSASFFLGTLPREDSRKSRHTVSEILVNR